MTAPAGWENFGPWRGEQGQRGEPGQPGVTGPPGLRLLTYGEAPGQDIPAGASVLLTLHAGMPAGGNILAVAYAAGSKITAAGQAYLTIGGPPLLGSFRSAGQDHSIGGQVAASLTVPGPLPAGSHQFTLTLTSTTNHWRVTTARLAVYEIGQGSAL